MPGTSKTAESTTFAIHLEGTTASADRLRAAADAAVEALGDAHHVRVAHLTAGGEVTDIVDVDAQRRHFDHGKVALDELEHLTHHAEDDEYKASLPGKIETARAFGLNVDEKAIAAKRKASAPTRKAAK